MSHRPTQKEKTQRAFQAYLDLLDAAEWFKAQMRAPLESFDLTMKGFRLLVFFFGRTPPDHEVARRRGCTLQNTHPVIARLQARRWVEQAMMTFHREIAKAASRWRSAASDARAKDADDEP